MEAHAVATKLIQGRGAFVLDVDGVGSCVAAPADAEWRAASGDIAADSSRARLVIRRFATGWCVLSPPTPLSMGSVDARVDGVSYAELHSHVLQQLAIVNARADAPMDSRRPAGRSLAEFGRSRQHSSLTTQGQLVSVPDLGAPIGTPPEQLGGFAASPTADEMRTAARELSSACCSTKAMLAHYAAARGISLEGALSSVLLPKAAVVPARPTEHEASANESAPPHASQRRAARRQLVWGGIDLIRSDGTSRVSRHDHVGGVRLARGGSLTRSLSIPTVMFARAVCCAKLRQEPAQPRLQWSVRDLGARRRHARGPVRHTALALSHADTNCLDHRFCLWQASRAV